MLNDLKITKSLDYSLKDLSMEKSFENWEVQIGLHANQLVMSTTSALPILVLFQLIFVRRCLNNQ